MRGRKRIPSKLIALKGGKQYTHRSENTQEPRPPERLPPCPKHLDDAARKEWRRVGKVLNTLGLISDLDVAVLAGYCQSYAEWCAALDKVRQIGTVGKRADGTPMLNPWLRVAREAFDRWMKAAPLLGLSPSSRASLKVDKPKPASKFTGLIGGKTRGQR